MKTATPRRMAVNAIVLAGLPAAFLYALAFPFEFVLQLALDSPAITVVVVAVYVFSVLFGSNDPEVGPGGA